MTTRLATSLIALSSALATPTLADVTAADVFANQQALYSASGVMFSGDLSGDQLLNPEFNVILPQGVASFQIKADSVTMTENSDGTVTIIYPSPMNITVSGSAMGEGSFTAQAVMTNDTYTITASGTPGDIAYSSNGQNMRLEFGEITVDQPTAPKVSIDGFVELDLWSGNSRITEGNLISYSSSGDVGVTTADVTLNFDGAQSRSLQRTLPLQSTVAATLPVGGSDPMNISAALRNGLSLLVTSTGEGNTSDTTTTIDGQIMDRQTTTIGTQTFNASLDDTGFTMDAVTNSFDMLLNNAMVFPDDIKFAMSEVSMNLDVPINASDMPQDFRLATSLQGITMGDEIWDMFDPSGMLPRDPAEISYDITGVGTNGIDLLDFQAMASLFGAPPIEVDEVTIENLRITAAGLDATANGAMTFDWTDFQTIPGIARPEGQITLNVNGANQLMDTLANMGLISQDELMMPRMMMGMFSTPVGDDMLETVLEVNSQGHVLANGQRLQ